ncbi:glycoside hydrolase family 125 protein [Acidicapsa ligni]|uniref:glycoside hydrolase family 125 protein n=1 Tax=Acidicapsa ligni TaxID=542300 RepID=UPI0021E07A6F|nr:glycoside hydrolase family 125 protein [Acidicapsa ligni]
MSPILPSRRSFVMGAAALTIQAHGLTAMATDSLSTAIPSASALPHARPALADRRFQSPAVEALITRLKPKIADANLATIFENCFPNTLDTTVTVGTFEGKPDTYVVTGDIDAMWLRDSSAQVVPYLPLVNEDPGLRTFVEGLIRRQARLILLDSYANAFLHSPSDPPLSWAVKDVTTHIAGVGERKWEIDSLCYPIRLAYGYWKAAGSGSITSAGNPFDKQWQASAWKIVQTFREQQRKHDQGPYSFQREALAPTDTLPLSGFGNPAKPVGMIFSGFRPSDDACVYPLFVPANLFAVTSLRQLAELATHTVQDQKLAAECHALATEVEAAVRQHGIVHNPEHGEIWAYEVDGYGNALMMDDANAPGLLSLAYLGCCKLDDPLYQRTRNFAWSMANPYFFRGNAAEGIGGPHEGLNSVWPMSIMMRAFTSTSDTEIRQCLRWLRDTTAGTGFMHETFHPDNPSQFTRPWFAWANTLFGELIVKLSTEKPHLLAEKL